MNRQNSGLPGGSYSDLISALCHPRTAVVADGNEVLFARVAEELPLEILRVPSGSQHNGWVVPENWRVVKCQIWRAGELVFDGEGQTLSVGYYSKTFTGDLSWDDLDKHLVTNPDLPDGYMFHCEWQYRPWAAEWVISIPYSIYVTMGDGTYHVDLQTETYPGEMLIGVSNIRGASSKTIVLNSNNCHPHMANDGFAGTAVLIRIMQWLVSVETFYSYRLLLAPEHLGSVFYLAQMGISEINDIVACIFEEMPGTQGALVATSTFLGDSQLDLAVANSLKHHTKAFEIAAWRQGAGNDETVWEAPGYEIPCIELTRRESQFAPYREYHSSLDRPELMDDAQLDEVFVVLQETIKSLEGNVTLTRSFDGLPCLSNPQYDLYLERFDPTVNKLLPEDSERWGHLLDSLLRYFDGKISLLEIAERHELPFTDLQDYVQKFVDSGLAQVHRVELEPPWPIRVTE